ncbi:MAG: VOC family protein [Oscillospiraceae bacterium]|jgi:lactoylglutathione lyase|nr:VOC family protein [Oscillospiraceae bacterium]
MEFKFAHNNINVLDIDKSLKFYSGALGLTELHRHETPDFKIVFLGDGSGAHALELTQLCGRTEPYDLGDNEIHLAFTTPDMDAARSKHREMGCICYENPVMGIYFIEDPDGYWMEIIPER